VVLAAVDCRAAVAVDNSDLVNGMPFTLRTG
jgi:hypothetical protein